MSMINWKPPLPCRVLDAFGAIMYEHWKTKAKGKDHLGGRKELKVHQRTFFDP